MKRSVLLYCGFFIIVLDLRLTKLVRACRETGFNFFMKHLCFGFNPTQNFFQSVPLYFKESMQLKGEIYLSKEVYILDYSYLCFHKNRLHEKVFDYWLVSAGIVISGM